MAPTLVASYTAAQTRNTTTLTTGAFTASAGEVIVVKITNESGFVSPAAPTATGLTFTRRAEATTGSSNDCYAGLYTAVVPAGGGTYTVTAASSGSNLSHSFVVERWSNAQLAATPATNAVTGNTTCSSTLTTTAANSVVSWASADWNAVTYTTRTYRSSATEEFVAGTSGSDYFAAFAYQSAATAGSQTYGMTQPTGQKDSMVAIEIQDAGTSGNTFTSNPSESIGLTDSVQVDTAPANSATLYGGTATTGGAATWANASFATGAPDGTNATWTNATAGATGWLDLTYDFSSLVPSNATLVSVAVTCRTAVGNTTRMAAPTSQVYIGGSAIGSPSTLALATALTDTTYNPSLTLAQVRDSTFKVRINANKASGNSQSSTTSIDGVTVVVNYTAPSANYSNSPGDNAGITDTVSTIMSGQIAASPADSVGATDAVAVVKTVTTTVTDAASGSDTPSVAFQGNVSSTPSESVGLTDSVSANLATGGGTATGFNLLANYKSSAPSGTHTITLSAAPTRGSVFVMVDSQATTNFTGDNANWVQVYQFLDQRDIRIMRLDQANYGTNKTSITITISNSACDLIAVVWEDTVDGSITPYHQPYTGQQPNGSGAWGTGISNPTTGTNRAIAYWIGGWGAATDASTFDLTSYDKSAVEKADTGYVSNATYGSMRMWVTEIDTLTPWINDGVIATQSSNWNSLATSAYMVGVFAYKAAASTSQNYTKTISDSAGATDAVTPNFNGSIPALASDTANATDSVTAALSSAATVNIEMLASYNGAASGTHTITLSHAPNLNTLYFVANSHGLMTLDGGSGGWVQVISAVNNIEYAVYRLDNPSTSKTSITVTHYNGNAVELAAVVFQAHVDGTGTPYISPRQNDLTSRNGLTSVGTGLHTYSGESATLAVFNTCGNSGVLSSAIDITAYDSGFTEFADTGLSTSTYGDSRIWMGINQSTGSMSNTGVTGTVTGAVWNSGQDSFGGVISLKLLPAPSSATDYVKNISDSAGATDQMTPNFNGSIPVLVNDNAGITDSVTAQRVTPASTNLEVLAQYSNGATGATSHTINFSHAPTLNTLYLIAMSAGTMTVDGGTGGWVNVSSRLNTTDQKIWRLDNPSSSKTSITITATNAVSVAAIVFQANVDTNVSPYINPLTNALNGRIGQSTIGTGLHTYSGQTASIAYYSINGSSGALSGSQDLVSFDRSFINFAKTGLARSTYGDVGLWLAVEKNTGSINNGGVTATTALAWDCGDDSYGGMLALNLLPVSGSSDQNLGDSAGITDGLSVLVNGTQASPTIYQENYNAPLVGVVQSDNFWLQGVSQTGIPGFARSTYYLPGQTAQFSVGYNTAFNVEIWRMGAYPGQTHGAHKIATVAGTGATQPSPTTIANSNGAVDYSNWSVNASWTIPNDVTPGWYYALFRGQAVTSDLGFYLFCVSDKNAKKPLLVVSSDSTFNGAYNTYGPGNKSLYGSGGPIGGTGGITDRALAASLNRPVDTRLSVPQTFWMNSEMPFLRFLERFGYEAGHATNEQVENDPTILDGRTCIVFNGHNEYISQAYWDKVADLQANTSVNIINFAANDFFWRIRYGTLDSTDKATKGRVIWCHKDTMSGPGTHVAGTQLDPLEWLGTWQDTRWAGRRVIANLFADIFEVNGVRGDEIFVPDTMKALPLWRNCTRVQALASGASLGLGTGTLGMEWDSTTDVGAPPTTKLSSTDVVISGGLSDANGENYSGSGTAHHAFQIMRNAGGGYTFTGSTTQWAWALDDFHDRGTLVANADAQQATINLLADFGIMPVASTVTAASLTYPTPVSNVGTAYAIPAGIGTNFTSSPADNAGVTDAVAVSHDYVISIGDTAGVTDSTNSAATDSVSIGDSAGITDSVTGWTEYLKTASDNAGITDAVTFTQGFVETQSDTASITDSVSTLFQGQITQTPSDIANGTDTATVDLARLFTQGPNEQANITDAVTIDQARVMQVSLTENIGATESYVLLDEELFADNAGITDTTTIVKAVNAALTESISGTDLVTPSVQTNATQGLPENIGATDSITLLAAISKSNADTANLSDAIASVRTMIRTLSDSVGATDSLTAVKNAQGNFKVWNGSTEAPLTIQGWWNGTSVVPLTYDQMT